MILANIHLPSLRNTGDNRNNEDIFIVSNVHIAANMQSFEYIAGVTICLMHRLMKTVIQNLSQLSIPII